MKTRSQRRDYLEKKRDMLNRMCDITDSVFNYIYKYEGTNSNMAQLINEIYFGRPYHVPLNQCVFPGTTGIEPKRI